MQDTCRIEITLASSEYSLPGTRRAASLTTVPSVDFSDHMNYWDAGYRAVMITDTAFYRNATYHTSRDVPETLDYDRMAKVIEGVYAAVLAFAGQR